MLLLSSSHLNLPVTQITFTYLISKVLNLHTENDDWKSENSDVTMKLKIKWWITQITPREYLHILFKTERGKTERRLPTSRIIYNAKRAILHARYFWVPDITTLGKHQKWPGWAAGLFFLQDSTRKKLESNFVIHFFTFCLGTSTNFSLQTANIYVYIQYD